MSLLTKKIWRNYPSFLNTEQESEELYIITESLRQAIEEAGLDVETSKKMMYLLTAEDKWIDRWGSYFGVERVENEDDETYKQRIIWEVVRPKQTVQGIKEYIARYTGLNENEIIIFEPFIKLQPLDFGAKTDSTRLAGWDYWTWGIVDVQVPIQIDNKLIQEINEATKAYGIKVFITTYNSYQTYIVPFSILSEYFSLAEIDFNLVKIITILDTRGYPDGRLLAKPETTGLHEFIISYVVGLGEYPFGEGEFGNVPFGGSSIIFESVLYID